MAAETILGALHSALTKLSGNDFSALDDSTYQDPSDTNSTVAKLYEDIDRYIESRLNFLLEFWKEYTQSQADWFKIPPNSYLSPGATFEPQTIDAMVEDFANALDEIAESISPKS
jgi:hypothetical protein